MKTVIYSILQCSRVDGFFGFYVKTKKPGFYRFLWFLSGFNGFYRVLSVFMVFTIQTSTNYNFFITKN